MARRASGAILEFLRRVAPDPKMRTIPDHELLQRFLDARDGAAFEALLRRHAPMVLDVCRGVLANEADTEDAFQATFLVLAHKAGSIRRATTLASWLHGVAYRTALKARADTARRRKHETQVSRPEVTGPDSLTWPEVRAVLHEELGELSERHRGPLVLCYLEGKTQDEAAALCGLSKGTLKRRLERGRALLRARLLRRGLGPSAFLLAVAWPATAGVARATVVSTVQAATRVAAGGAASGLVSARVLALAEGVVKVMLFTKFKVITAVLFVAALLGGGAAMVVLPVQAEPLRAGADGPATPDQAKAQPEPKPQGDAGPAVGAGKPIIVDAGGNVEALAWSPVGKLLATKVLFKSPTPDGGFVRKRHALQLRDAETGAVRRTLYEEDAVGDVRFSPDGKSVAAAVGRAVKLWDLETGKEQRTFQGDMDSGVALTNIAVSRDGRLLAAAGKVPEVVAPGESDGVVILWETASGKLLWQARGHRTIYWDRGVAFSPDGKILATGAGETIKLWDTATGKCKHTHQAHGYKGEGHEGEGRGGVWSLAFSPDGKLLASGGLDGTVRLWDPDAGALKLKQRLTSGYVLDEPLLVAFSPDGRRLAVGGGDIRLFDARTGMLERTFTDLGFRSGVHALAFSPDGRSLAAAANWNNQLLLLPLPK